MTGIKNWLLFSLIAMIVFSVSNIILKNLFNELGSSNMDLSLIGKLSGIQYLMVFSIVILTLIGAISFLNAINNGKPALVMAVISLSTVLVAILSVVFLKDQFTTKEIIGMALATISIIILAV